MRATLRKTQQGLVLFIALIVLVAMSLAGIALMRSVDTGTIISGNLAFRQAAMHTGDLGVEAARSYLMGVSPAANLYNDNAGEAYYGNWAENLVLVGTATGSQVQFDWSTAKAVTSPAPPAGYSVSYVIHRLCKESTFDPTATTCVKQTGSGSTTGGGTKGAAAFGTMAITVPSNALYRITVRVVGPRNSTSYIQAVVF
jgi:Tfp pilus assembly protein PilX